LNLSPDTSVLVTGASGALGWVLARRLAGNCRVAGTYFSHDVVPDGVEPVRMDLKDPGTVAAAMEAHRPRVVVHAAAMTSPDDCERDPASARAVNLYGSAALAEHASKLGSRVVYVSTDLVFDGKRGNYREQDEACPVSVYGRAKMDAERAFLERPGRAGVARPAVIRSSLIYGWGSPASGTFLSGLHGALRSGKGMRLFTDQMRNPVLEEDLAESVILAISHDLEGVYHAGGPEAVSRLDFGRAVCEVFGFDEGLLEPIAMSDFEYVADRPLDSTLNISKLAGATGFSPSSLRDGLARLASSLPD
jgi:dTDP-4-dehydrorhamnose reductase